jgi:predicted nucleic acid-binding protein
VDTGDLVVFWSREIQEEIRGVARREAVAAAMRPFGSRVTDELSSAIEAALERIDLLVDDQMDMLSRYFHLAPTALNSAALALEDVSDPDDRLHIRSAHAAGANYLLTLDNRHLLHGAIYAGVACWHPDTFLTLFFQQNPAAYTRTVRALKRLPSALATRLL